MLLNQMKYFISVVNNNSFKEAAKENNISQSAISQAIKSLEDELGVKLFQRRNRGFTITRGGKYFYEKSLLMEKELNKLKKNTAKVANYKKPTLSVGYEKTFYGKEIHEALIKFSKIHPKINVYGRAGNHKELLELLKKDELDLIFTDDRGDLPEEYNKCFLCNTTCYAIVPENFPFRRRKKISFEDLRKYPCIIIANRNQQVQELGYYRFELKYYGKFIFEDSIYDAIRSMSYDCSYLLLDLFPTYTKAQENFEGMRKILFIQNGKELQKSYYVIWNKNSRNKNKKEYAKILKSIFYMKVAQKIGIQDSYKGIL